MTRFNLLKNGKYVGYYKTNNVTKVYDDLINRYGIDKADEFEVEVVKGVPIGEDAIEWQE